MLFNLSLHITVFIYSAKKKLVFLQSKHMSCTQASKFILIPAPPPSILLPLLKLNNLVVRILEINLPGLVIKAFIYAELSLGNPSRSNWRLPCWIMKASALVFFVHMVQNKVKAYAHQGKPDHAVDLEGPIFPNFSCFGCPFNLFFRCSHLSGVKMPAHM